MRKFIPLAAAAIGMIGALAVPPGAAASAVNPNAVSPQVTTSQCGGGIFARQVTPSADFDPLTATDAQLVANDLPPHPTGAEDQAVWRNFVTKHPETHSSCNLKEGRRGSTDHTLQTKPSEGAASPLDTSVHSANWDGNIADSQSYTDAFGTYKVPKTLSSAASYSASWVGVGHGRTATQPLAQGGSYSGGNPMYALIWELYPQIDAKIISYDVMPGDTVYVHAHLSYNNDWIVVKDETTGAGGTYGLDTTSIWPDNTAEWIFERPTVGGYLPTLANATTSFTGATALGTGYGGTSLHDLPHHWASMWNCKNASNTELANAGPIAANGAFNAYWLSSGTATKKSSCTAVW
jgi:Peptidase A4 family